MVDVLPREERRSDAFSAGTNPRRVEFRIDDNSTSSSEPFFPVIDTMLNKNEDSVVGPITH